MPYVGDGIGRREAHAGCMSPGSRSLLRPRQGVGRRSRGSATRTKRAGRRSLVATGLVVALVCAVVGALVPGPGYAANPACRPGATLVNPCRPWLGASVNNHPQYQASLRPQVTYHEQRIGRQVDIVHAYNQPGTTLTTDETYFATRPDTILYLNWRPTLTWANASGSDPATNASIDAVAQSIQALGSTKIFLAVAHEPESSVSGTPSGCTSAGTGAAGTTDDYRAMWRNVRARFDALGSTTSCG